MCNLIACIQATRQHYSNFSSKENLKFTKKYISCEKWKVALEMLNQAWGVVIFLVIRWVFNPISRGISGLNRVIRSKLWALCFITADFNKGGPSVKTAWFVWALRFFTINFLLFWLLRLPPSPIISTFIAPSHFHCSGQITNISNQNLSKIQMWTIWARGLS